MFQFPSDRAGRLHDARRCGGTKKRTQSRWLLCAEHCPTAWKVSLDQERSNTVSSAATKNNMEKAKVHGPQKRLNSLAPPATKTKSSKGAYHLPWAAQPVETRFSAQRGAQRGKRHIQRGSSTVPLIQSRVSTENSSETLLP